MLIKWIRYPQGIHAEGMADATSAPAASAEGGDIFSSWAQRRRARIKPQARLSGVDAAAHDRADSEPAGCIVVGLGYGLPTREAYEDGLPRLMSPLTQIGAADDFVKKNPHVN
ncbi:hypothetical protein BOTBODRAFT_181125 [Botryobasidium botryosum FD-172 SS1]|uniref:Uncharacterized protein n=1 Tax=Botryobasidium botryosum (strain FD-172 SS1) TaxID=930990 RepID=A0A067LUJ3_BOTB1|nr:hypothetical protein BOTBODRAFT_181125 [Botryobasidium botryosum FD-172 SS1]